MANTKVEENKKLDQLKDNSNQGVSTIVTTQDKHDPISDSERKVVYLAFTSVTVHQY